MLDKFAIAAALREIGAYLELKGENQFKVRAYDNGAAALEALNADLDKMIAEKRLTEVKGIGKALADKIGELYNTGRSAMLEELRGQMPPGLLELSQVPDVGPKKAQALYDALKIDSVAALKAACLAGQVRGVKGFGEKSEQKFLAGIERYQTREHRILLGDVIEDAEKLLEHVRRSPAVSQAELGGSMRRWRETVADVDIVAATRDPAAAMDHFVAWPQVAKVEARGDTKCTVRFGNGLQVDLRAVPPEDFATALHHFTGSKEHHVKLRGLARDQGYTLSEWGLERIAKGAKTGDKVAIASEAELYRKLGLPLIPPELREDAGEFEAAAAGDKFDDLITLADVQGMVHCHTVYSDGRNTVEEMAREAESLGMKYLTITDHSPTASYAGGVTVDRLKKQWDEIAKVQETVKVKLLRGTESDILEDGGLDYPDNVLEQFDVVIASIHSRMKMDEDQMTRRLVAAMRHPVRKIWGHALGRLVQKRDPIACRVEEVLDAIAESRAYVEVNGDPHRLDMEPRWLRLARKRGIKFVISTDAHSIGELHNLRFGIGIARRGGLRRGEVLNALPLADFKTAVKPAA